MPITTVTDHVQDTWIISYNGTEQDPQNLQFNFLPVGSKFYTGKDVVEQYTAKGQLIARLTTLMGTPFTEEIRTINKLNRG